MPWVTPNIVECEHPKKIQQRKERAWRTRPRLRIIDPPCEDQMLIWLLYYYDDERLQAQYRSLLKASKRSH